MDWSKDASLYLSQLCVMVFTGLLAGLCVAAPWLWPRLVGRGAACGWYLAVTYLTALPAALVLYRLQRLLHNMGENRVFIPENVRICGTSAGCALPRGACTWRGRWPAGWRRCGCWRRRRPL